MPPTKPTALISFILLATSVLLIAGLIPHSAALFSHIQPNTPNLIYQRESFFSLIGAHLLLVLTSSLISITIALSAAIFVTRPIGREFEPLLSTFSTIGQTFPPAAVLAISVPMVGFGFLPALIALIIYGILPIIENTIQGLKNIDPHIHSAAQSMGMNPSQRLIHIELPLAMPLIISGIRTSVMINIGTATIGSTVGSKSLGTPIIAGLINHNIAYVIQGALLVGLLALTIDRLFDLYPTKQK